jgi:dienelactone hydrolase
MVQIAAVAAALPTASIAQQPSFALRPASGRFTVVNDIEYGRSDTTVLRMDVYRPSAFARSPGPTLIYFNRGVGRESRNALFPSHWARVAASRGVAVVVADLRDRKEAADFLLLLSYLTARGAQHGVDRDAIAVFAASGNVYSAFPVVEDPKQTAVKAAVMYYGSAPITEFRLDLPVLYVRAGLDRPEVNRQIAELASLAISQNAPMTLLNHPTGYHAFEAFNDDDATRDVMEQTITFVRRATSPGFQAALRRGIPEAAAAGFVQRREFGRAAPIYADLVASRPNDARLGLSYGEALLGNGQFAEACAEFEKLKGRGLGPRDLGLPAARACVQKGDADAAIAWLRTIPSRFLPSDVQNEPVFAALRDREDFRALFSSR